MDRLKRLAALFLLSASGASAQQQAPAPTAEGIEFFEKRIRPVLVEKCYRCHSSQPGSKVKAELFLDTREGILKGGESGPAVVPGDPEKSLLVKAVRYTDEDLEMPPKEADRLTLEQVKDFETWVRMGAPDPRAADAAKPAEKPKINFEEGRKFWSYRPVSDPPVPAVRDRSWPGSPIDSFVLAGLEERGLRPVGETDRRTLLRRATFDLIGLPPTPEEIEAFLGDSSPRAFEKVVDRLLESPHYGERWGRRWMDVVRYADTAGCNSDYPIPQMWRYRNWVIDAFNRDLPYDEFIRRQIAGDLLPWKTWDERNERVIATGYLAATRRFASSETGTQHLVIEDTIDNLGKTFLGLSVNCARCHDHKFDAIGSEDYYALYGIFESTRYPFPGVELNKVPRDLVPLIPQEEADRILGPYKAELARHEGEVKKLETERADLQKVVSDDDERRRASPGAEPSAKAGDARKRLDEIRDELRRAQRKRDEYAKTVPVVDSAYSVWEGAKPANAKLQVRGDPKNPGPEVPRRFLEVLGGQALPGDAKGSGRRELAEWLADPRNPLVPRVMANRIWQGHFGKGIVQTPNDFGVRGARPTHPALLDYLARRFVESGFSVKAMHRLIMLSRTYRLASSGLPEQAKVDPANDALWKFSRRRLEAEEIRDGMLAVSGALDRTPGGPHPFPPQSGWTYTQHKPFVDVYETDRRSVYVMTMRIKKHPFFGIFDGPDTNATTPARTSSTTPLQALWMMNDSFVHDQARKLAWRLILARPDDGKRMELAYLLAFGRPPAAEEGRSGVDYLAKVRSKFPGISPEQQAAAAWESYARVLFRMNEFITVD
jgi:hypothetical protein